MISQIIEPKSFRLKQYVPFFWVLKVPASSGPGRPVLPAKPCFDLLFSFADSTTFQGPQDRQLHLSNSYICGIRKECFRLHPHGAVDYLAVRFLPHCLYQFMNFPLVEISNLAVDIDSLKEEWLMDLHNQLEELPDTEQRLVLLEKHLLARLDYRLNNPRNRGDEEYSSLLNHGLTIIGQHGGSTSVKDLCAALHVNAKMMEREFKKYIGVTPKFYSRITRFSRVLHHLESGTGIPDWRMLALECGYFDQAHMIKEFKHFMDQSPQTYCKTGFSTSHVGRKKTG